MKKSYLMIVAAAALFSACANEVIVDKTAMKTQDQPFTFEAFADKTTRADQTNSTNLYDFYKPLMSMVGKQLNQQLNPCSVMWQ